MFALSCATHLTPCCCVVLCCAALFDFAVGARCSIYAESTDHLTEVAWDWNWLKIVGLTDYLRSRWVLVLLLQGSMPAISVTVS